MRNGYTVGISKKNVVLAHQYTAKVKKDSLIKYQPTVTTYTYKNMIHSFPERIVTFSLRSVRAVTLSHCIKSILAQLELEVLFTHVPELCSLPMLSESCIFRSKISFLPCALSAQYTLHFHIRYRA
jgi:hypothetical protein